VSDAQIQLISGHESKKSPEIYQHLSLKSLDKAYQEALRAVGIYPEFDSWEAHGGVWSASRLRQNKHLRVREGRFEPKRLDTWISEICLPTARVDEYYWIHVLA
jgi:hypothetical protein